jgi:hypothetical protein
MYSDELLGAVPAVAWGCSCRSSLRATYWNLGVLSCAVNCAERWFTVLFYAVLCCPGIPVMCCTVLSCATGVVFSTTAVSVADCLCSCQPKTLLRCDVLYWPGLGCLVRHRGAVRPHAVICSDLLCHAVLTRFGARLRIAFPSAQW